MANPYVGEIRAFGFNFAPRGWATCDGQIIPISQNTALFSILGTTYGGNGISNFALPNLQGATPLGQGQGPSLSTYVLGQSGGTETVTLGINELPSHNHTANAVAAPGTLLSPQGRATAEVRGGTYAATHDATMNAAALAANGNGLPHNNMPPYLTVTFCIALQGVFPPRS